MPEAEEREGKKQCRGQASGRGDSERRRKCEAKEAGDVINLGETVGGSHRWRKRGSTGRRVTELCD